MQYAFKEGEMGASSVPSENIHALRKKINEGK